MDSPWVVPVDSPWLAGNKLLVAFETAPDRNPVAQQTDARIHLGATWERQAGRHRLELHRPACRPVAVHWKQVERRVVGFAVVRGGRFVPVLRQLQELFPATATGQRLECFAARQMTRLADGSAVLEQLVADHRQASHGDAAGLG